MLRLLILLLALAAPAAGYLQMSLGLGQTPAEFAADSDANLKVATYAFGIWGVIYAGLLAYGIYQLLPGTPRTPFLRRMAVPSALALAGIAAWIFAAAYDIEWLTIVLIAGSAAVLIGPLMAAGPGADGATGRERLFVAWPLGLLAGWLTIASAANVLTVLTGNGQLPDIPVGWGVVTVGLVAVIALWVLARLRHLAYPIPIVWGLAAVYVAEQDRNPPLALSAAIAAVILALAAAWFVSRRKRA